MTNVLNEMIDLFGDGLVLKDEPMSKHTTFKIGGKADIFVMPDSEEKLLACINICKNNMIDYYIIGNGSNLLVRDGGYRGVIIQLYKNYNDIKIEGNIVTASCGALLSTVANVCCKNSLSGMEFAGGIPGTIGGAICMNAGAYGGEMKDITNSIRVIDKGVIKDISIEDVGMGYRTSRILKEGMVVLSATFGLSTQDKEIIRIQMNKLNKSRNEKQPIEFPSAGSTFKRPEGYFAAKLIDDAGLRGFSIGGASVSEKHCGFLINKGGATASDVIELMKEVSSRVEEKTGVKLEPEMRIIGSDE